MSGPFLGELVRILTTRPRMGLVAIDMVSCKLLQGSTMSRVLVQAYFGHRGHIWLLEEMNLGPSCHVQ